jgi:hypothetical protein
MSPMSPAAQFPPAADPTWIPFNASHPVPPVPLCWRLECFPARLRVQGGTLSQRRSARLPRCLPARRGEREHERAERTGSRSEAGRTMGEPNRSRLRRPRRKRARSKLINLLRIPWNMRLGDRKQPELPQLQPRRRKSLMINSDGVGNIGVVTSQGRRPGGGRGSGIDHPKIRDRSACPAKILPMAHLRHPPRSPFTWPAAHGLCIGYLTPSMPVLELQPGCKRNPVALGIDPPRPR